MNVGGYFFDEFFVVDIFGFFICLWLEFYKMVLYVFGWVSVVVDFGIGVKIEYVRGVGEG